MKAAHQLINQDSGNVERYTPKYIVDAAREVMGGIDLDPASCKAANSIHQITRIYAKEDNGLTLPWEGRVWMNHPFHKGEEVCKEPLKCKKKTCLKRGFHCTERVPSNADWINYLVSEFRSGRTKQFCNICFLSASEGWFQPLQRFWRCEFDGRIDYIDEFGNDAGSSTKGSCVHYGGPNEEKFADVFSRFGAIKVPYRRAQQ